MTTSNDMNDFYTFALAFAGEHWFLAWCVLWLLWVPYLLGVLVFRCWNRLLRTIRVALRGWPPEHLDADGDWRPAPKRAGAAGALEASR